MENNQNVTGKYYSMKFKLYCVEDIASGTGAAPTSHTTEFEAVGLNVILLNIEQFLRGCGFYLENLDYDLPGIRRRDKHISEREPF